MAISLSRFANAGFGSLLQSSWSRFPIRRIALLVSVITALVASQTANADSRHDRRGYDRHGYSSFSRNVRHSQYRRIDSRRYNSYHYGNRRHSGVSVSFNNHYYPRRYSRTRYSGDAGYFVGGLVLGSLLSYPRYSPPPVERVVYRSEPVVRTREVIVVNQSTQARVPVASGRRLLRDLEGNCFERIVDESGNEIRIQLEPEECGF